MVGNTQMEGEETKGIVPQMKAEDAPLLSHYLRFKCFMITM